VTWFKRMAAPKPSGDAKRASVPTGLWTKCPSCAEVSLAEEVTRNLETCGECGFHYRLEARPRLLSFLDEDSFIELAADLGTADPLEFHDDKDYLSRAKASAEKAGEAEAFVLGQGRLFGRPIIAGSFVFRYMGGSMGSVVGEKIARAFELGAELRAPVVIFSASGGARMQEGIFSLMQMAKTTVALNRFREVQQPYISILTDPTTGGVAASFALLGDVIIAEPGALVGFAGPRVIEQTIRQKLPEGFQRSEFLLEHGVIDMIVPRQELRERAALLCQHLCAR
jgi:acetyl-CoA carboxylase carboxyl transferase subunit beta